MVGGDADAFRRPRPDGFGSSIHKHFSAGF
jgi:hypothetical protein